MTSDLRYASHSTPHGGADFLGHPRGLSYLFATEMWERFSYFGNAALVVLYMVKYLLEPGRVEAVIGYGAVKGALEALFGPLDPQPFASQLFGFYTGLAYSMPILGGLIADRALGQRRTVLIGGVLMACGHFMMAFESLFLFALLMLILGIGAFKPNVSTQVGDLYPPGDPRRDRAYSIFYVGINIGALLAPLVCGSVAVAFGWHMGFAAAGIAMLISIAIYVRGLRWLTADRVSAQRMEPHATHPLNPQQRGAVIALILVCGFVSLFWAAYDQQGNTIVLWAEDFTERSIDLVIWRGEIPTTWFLALNPLMIFVFTPLVVRLWTWQSKRGSEPFSIRKMAFGCLMVALANLIMAGAAWTAPAGGKVSPLWLIGYFGLATIGELFLAPVGLALISKVAPAGMLSMIMGVWFAATLPGDILAGWLGGFWMTITKTDFFLLIAGVAMLAGAAIWFISGWVSSVLDAKVEMYRTSTRPKV